MRLTLSTAAPCYVNAGSTRSNQLGEKDSRAKQRYKPNYRDNKIG